MRVALSVAGCIAQANYLSSGSWRVKPRDEPLCLFGGRLRHTFSLVKTEFSYERGLEVSRPLAAHLRHNELRF